MFAMLDKSVYHIFGEDCARYVPDAGVFRITVASLGHLACGSVPFQRDSAAQKRHFHLVFAVFHSQSVNYRFAAASPRKHDILFVLFFFEHPAV